MSEREARVFESLPFAADAVKLRRWDDEAKIPGWDVPAIEHYRSYLEQCLDSR